MDRVETQIDSDRQIIKLLHQLGEQCHFQTLRDNKLEAEVKNVNALYQYVERLTSLVYNDSKCKFNTGSVGC